MNFYKVMIFFVFSFTTFANAENKYACVQHQNKDYSWNGPYKLPVIIIDGDDLNIVVESDEYDTYETYALVRWPNNGYSVLKLPLYSDELSEYSYMEVLDQHDEPYKIKSIESDAECSTY